MFFTEVCPSGGTKYVPFELLLGILGGPGRGEYGTFAKPKGYFTEGMSETC